LFRTLEVPGHPHLTKLVDGLGEIRLGLFAITGGLEQATITRTASSQLWFGSRVSVDSDGLLDLLLPPGVSRAQPDQRFGEGSMRESDAEPIAALLAQDDRFLGDSARLVELAQRQE